MREQTRVYPHQGLYECIQGRVRQLHAVQVVPVDYEHDPRGIVYFLSQGPVSRYLNILYGIVGHGSVETIPPYELQQIELAYGPGPVLIGYAQELEHLLIYVRDIVQTGKTALVYGLQALDVRLVPQQHGP